MKKFLFCLIFILFFISYGSHAAGKKERYNPDGKELFIINEYTPESRIAVHTAPKIGAFKLLPIEKYKGMVGYVDKIIKTDYDYYKKIVLKNGDVFYLNKNSLGSQESRYESEEYLISMEEYEKIKNRVEEIKRIKLDNLSDIFIREATVGKNGVYNVTLSNGLTLRWNDFKVLQNFIKNITDETDAKLLINTLNNGGIYLYYDDIDDFYQISMDGNSPLEVFLKIFGAKEVMPVAKVTYGGSSWVFANSFVIFQNGKKLSRDNVQFKRDSKSSVAEWYNFVCSKEDLDSIRLLDENEDATVRFYGSNYNKDKQVDKESIKKIKEIIALYDMLTKYYTTNNS
jgi:hypothetical protein